MVGTGTASAVPDVVRTTIGAETSAPTVDAALSGANAATRAVVDALTGRGVASGDVQTAGVQVYPQLSQDGRDVTGYTARQDLDVTLRDLDGASATIAAAAAGGDAARLSGIFFGLADESALRTQARAAAFADARATAQQHAELAGGRLGGVVSITEDAGGPSFARGRPAPARPSSAESAVPLAPGTSQVSVTVNVRWSLER